MGKERQSAALLCLTAAIWGSDPHWGKGPSSTKHGPAPDVARATAPDMAGAPLQVGMHRSANSPETPQNPVIGTAWDAVKISQ